MSTESLDILLHFWNNEHMKSSSAPCPSSRLGSTCVHRSMIST